MPSQDELFAQSLDQRLQTGMQTQPDVAFAQSLDQRLEHHDRSQRLAQDLSNFIANRARTASDRFTGQYTEGTAETEPTPYWEGGPAQATPFRFSDGDWDSTRRAILSEFQDLTPEVVDDLRGSFEEQRFGATQQRLANHFTDQARQRGEVPGFEGLARAAVPYVGRVMNMASGTSEINSADRLSGGNAREQDYRLLASRIAAQERLASIPLGQFTMSVLGSGRAMGEHIIGAAVAGPAGIAGPILAETGESYVESRRPELGTDEAGNTIVAPPSNPYSLGGALLNGIITAGVERGGGYALGGVLRGAGRIAGRNSIGRTLTSVGNAAVGSSSGLAPVSVGATGIGVEIFEERLQDGLTYAAGLERVGVTQAIWEQAIGRLDGQPANPNNTLQNATQMFIEELGVIGVLQGGQASIQRIMRSGQRLPREGTENYDLIRAGLIVELIEAPDQAAVDQLRQQNRRIYDHFDIDSTNLQKDLELSRQATIRDMTSPPEDQAAVERGRTGQPQGPPVPPQGPPIPPQGPPIPPQGPPTPQQQPDQSGPGQITEGLGQGPAVQEVPVQQTAPRTQQPAAPEPTPQAPAPTMATMFTGIGNVIGENLVQSWRDSVAKTGKLPRTEQEAKSLANQVYERAVTAGYPRTVETVDRVADFLRQTKNDAEAASQGFAEVFPPINQSAQAEAPAPPEVLPEGYERVTGEKKPQQKLKDYFKDRASNKKKGAAERAEKRRKDQKAQLLKIEADHGAEVRASEEDIDTTEVSALEQDEQSRRESEQQADLTAEEKTVVDLRNEGMTYRGIEKKTGINYQTAKNIADRAAAKMGNKVSQAKAAEQEGLERRRELIPEAPRSLEGGKAPITEDFQGMSVEERNATSKMSETEKIQAEIDKIDGKAKAEIERLERERNSDIKEIEERLMEDEQKGTLTAEQTDRATEQISEIRKRSQERREEIRREHRERNRSKLQELNRRLAESEGRVSSPDRPDTKPEAEDVKPKPKKGAKKREETATKVAEQDELSLMRDFARRYPGPDKAVNPERINSIEDAVTQIANADRSLLDVHVDKGEIRHNEAFRDLETKFKEILPGLSDTGSRYQDPKQIESHLDRARKNIRDIANDLNSIGEVEKAEWYRGGLGFVDSVQDYLVGKLESETAPKPKKGAKRPPIDPAVKKAGMSAQAARATKVSEDGKPVPVYHASVNTFDTAKITHEPDQDYGSGFYLTTSEDEAAWFVFEGDNVYEYYVDIRSPFYPDKPLSAREADKLLSDLVGNIPDGKTFAANPEPIDSGGKPPADVLTGKDVIVRAEAIVGPEATMEAFRRLGYDGMFGGYGLAENSEFDYQNPASNPISAFQQIVAFSPDQVYRSSAKKYVSSEGQAVQTAIESAVGKAVVADLAELRSSLPADLQGKVFDDTVIRMAGDGTIITYSDTDVSALSTEQLAGYVQDGNTVITTVSAPDSTPKPKPKKGAKKPATPTVEEDNPIPVAVEVKSAKEINQMISNGGIELFRGITGDPKAIPKPESGQLFTGGGAYGDGIYTYTAEKQNNANQFATPKKKGHVGYTYRLVLKPSAKTVTYAEAVKNLPPHTGPESQRSAEWAKANGYDAMIHEKRGIVVIANPDAVVMQSIFEDARQANIAKLEEEEGSAQEIDGAPGVQSTAREQIDSLLAESDKKNKAQKPPELHSGIPVLPNMIRGNDNTPIGSSDEGPPKITHNKPKQIGMRRTQPAPLDPLAVPDPDAERRLSQAEKGLQRTSMWQNLTNWWENVKKSVTRTQFHIPNTTEFDQAREVLRLIQNIPNRAKDEATRRIMGITNILPNKEHLKLFTRKVIIDNMVDSVENHGQPLRFGFKTLEEAKAYQSQLTALVRTTPKVQEALDLRREINRLHVQELIDRRLVDKDTDPTTYYHQQVLAKLAITKAAGGKRLKTMGRSFQKRRVTGESLSEGYDYNAMFIEAEYAWTVDSLMEMHKQDLEVELARHYDVFPDVLRRAQKSNRSIAEIITQDFPGHDIWKAGPGNVFYHTVSEAERMVADIQAVLTDPELVEETAQLKPLHQDLPTTGGPIAIRQNPVGQERVTDAQREAMEAAQRLIESGASFRVYPQEIVDQLDSMTRPLGEVPKNVAAQLMRSWKTGILFLPHRMLGYNLRNVTGDAEAVVAGGLPKSFLRIPQATKELYAYYMGEMSVLPPHLKSARDGGVFDSALTAEEIPDLRELPQFYRLYEQQSAIGKIGDLPGDYFQFVKKWSNFRESIARYAAYLEYLDLLEKGKLTHYGGSSKSVVDNLEKTMGKEVVAAHLSRNLLGDYGNLTVFGTWLRQNLIPFHSWTEVNTKRAPMLAINAVQYGLAKKTIAGKIAFTALGLSGLGAMTALTYLWNLLAAPEEEEELPDYVRSTPHITLPFRNSDGSVVAFRNVGIMGDLMQTVGLDQVIANLDEYDAGQISEWDLFLSAVAGARGRAFNSLRPEITGGYGVLTGQELYPDPARPRMEDRDVILANSALGSGQEYRWLRGQIMSTGEVGRGDYGWRVFGFGQYDPRTAAVGETYSMIANFQNANGSQSTPILPPSSTRVMRDAARGENYEAFRTARARYIASGKNLDNFVRSLDSLDPLSNVRNDQEQAFLSSLTPEQAQTLTLAQQYQSQTRTQMFLWWHRAAQESGQSQQIAQARQNIAGIVYQSSSPMPRSQGNPQRFQERMSNWQQQTQDARVMLDQLDTTIAQRRELLREEWIRRYGRITPGYYQRLPMLR